MQTKPLKDWAVFECQWSIGTGAPTRHFVGTCLGEARCSSAVVTDVAARSGISTKGNVYALVGEPGLRLHAIFLWQAFVESNRPVAVRDITEELFPDLVAQLNGPESIPGFTTEEAVVALQQEVDGTRLSERTLDRALQGDTRLAQNNEALDSSNEYVAEYGLPPSASSFLVEGEIIEVLPSMGIAHVRGANGVVYGLNPKTRGISFYELRAGQRVQCQVTAEFHRVLHARILLRD